MYKIIIIFTLIISSCSPINFEKDYYEKVTQIKFPSSYKIVATADNAEFVTITILDLEKSNCDSFKEKNHFKHSEIFQPKFLYALNLVDKKYQKLGNTENLLVREVDKYPGKVGWLYVLDTVSCRLYCQIDYPDWGGN